jgi:hypothetical protein
MLHEMVRSFSVKRVKVFVMHVEMKVIIVFWQGSFLDILLYKIKCRLPSKGDGNLHLILITVSFKIPFNISSTHKEGWNKTTQTKKKNKKKKKLVKVSKFKKWICLQYIPLPIIRKNGEFFVSKKTVFK